MDGRQRRRLYTWLSALLSLTDRKRIAALKRRKGQGEGGGKAQAEAKISTPQGARQVSPLSGEFVVLPTRSQICMKSPRHRGIEWT